MTSQDPSSTGGEPVGASPSPGPNSTTAGLAARGRAWLLILGLAMLAAVVAWQVGEATYDLFKLTPAVAANFRDPTGINREMPVVNSRNGAVAYGALGGLLGLALGLAGGLVARSAGRAALGAVAGLILGTAAGAFPSFIVMPWHWAHRNDDPASLNLLAPLLIHLGLWSAVGLAAGLAFGLGSQGSRPARVLEAALVGLVGAMVGIFAYEMIGAFLFPADHTVDPFPGTSAMRLLARLCIAGFVGLGVVRALPPAERRPGA
jgi:hypothetical protein